MGIEITTDLTSEMKIMAMPDHFQLLIVDESDHGRCTCITFRYEDYEALAQLLLNTALTEAVFHYKTNHPVLHPHEVVDRRLTEEIKKLNQRINDTVKMTDHRYRNLEQADSRVIEYQKDMLDIQLQTGDILKSISVLLSEIGTALRELVNDQEK